MAFLALYRQRLERSSSEQALAAAKACVCRALRFEGPHVNKAVSDARALLAFGQLGHIPLKDVPLPRAAQAAGRLLAQAVAKCSVAKASARRAQKLRGTRGGRRPQACTQIYRDLEGLVRSARGGDEVAVEMLHKITTILNASACAASNPKP